MNLLRSAENILLNLEGGQEQAVRKHDTSAVRRPRLTVKYLFFRQARMPDGTHFLILGQAVNVRSPSKCMKFTSQVSKWEENYKNKIVSMQVNTIVMLQAT